jgi:hypothetical protein
MSAAENQPRRYYSSRKGKESITVEAAHWRLHNLYLLYRDKDYFKEKLGVRQHDTPEKLARESVVRLGFAAFPLKSWAPEDMTEDHVFDVFEFLYDHASKPGELIDMRSESNWDYQDYGSYDEAAGRDEFRAAANLILVEMGDGFEIGKDGQVRANGTGGLQHILKAEILSFDPTNVDNKVVAAIERW